ncbi:endopeptidase La [Candidatus Beckwithbacteria bacterium]|nr:endopeptidase La [Candidatus Beckwithbacteria bacterium]
MENQDKPKSTTSEKLKPKNIVLPLVPLRDVVIFPYLEIVLSFGRSQSIKAVEQASKTDNLICLVAQKDGQILNPKEQDLYTIGTICKIERILKTNNEINALVKGIQRVKILKANLGGDFALAQVLPLPDIKLPLRNEEVLIKHISNNLKKLVNMGKTIDFLVFMKLMSGVKTDEFTDQIASILDIPTQEKQKLLEEIDINKRLIKVDDLLLKEIKISEIEYNIESKTQKKFDKSMKEAILRERMKTIQKELGESETEDADPEVGELRKKIAKAKMPKEVREKADKELNRLAKMHSYNPESGYIRAYLETLVELPWGIISKNDVTHDKAEKVLNDDHYALEEVKDRIMEYLSVMALKKKQIEKMPKERQNQKNTTILCFVGPPGVGKTSIARSIAKALGRKFTKVSIGGIRDEAEIRGHRRTYVGAMPGRIIQGIKDVGTVNPVFVLDEIDKIGSDFRGDPSSALLEALDPEQNFAFSDHYIEVPFDLSKVLFITTANTLDTIPPALRDRLEVIRFSGYTEDEKFQIAKKYLYEKTLYGNGLLKNQVKISDKTLKDIITCYTKEAGVRNLERELNKIMRKIARDIYANKKQKENVNEKNLHEYLGPIKFKPLLAEKKDESGMSTGLYWSSVGGGILFIEVALMPGKGRIMITGQLGDVMKESCQAALSFIRSHYKELNIDKDFAYKHDFHIHVPEGAMPKDGPSAGTAIATSLYSAISGKKVKKDLAMTGEITLRGRVLEIGGLKEKLIAAHAAGIKTVIIPKDNEKDLEKIPEKVKKELDIHFAQQIEDVFKIAFK